MDPKINEDSAAWMFFVHASFAISALAMIIGILAYKAHEEAERHRGLDELVAEGQKLGMY
jgi:hypothetical protein